MEEEKRAERSKEKEERAAAGCCRHFEKMEMEMEWAAVVVVRLIYSAGWLQSVVISSLSLSLSEKMLLINLCLLFSY